MLNFENNPDAAENGTLILFEFGDEFATFQTTSGILLSGNEKYSMQFNQVEAILLLAAYRRRKSRATLSARKTLAEMPELELSEQQVAQAINSMITKLETFMRKVEKTE